MMMMMLIMFLTLKLTIPYQTKKLVEYSFIPNDEDINDDIIIINDDNILASEIEPPKEIIEIKGVDSENEGVDNEVLPTDKKDIKYVTFPS